MKKITLETLAVESFETTAPGRESEGTVMGHMAPPPSQGGSDCLRTACCPDTFQATCTC
jgi:hypothetical protein